MKTEEITFLKGPVNRAPICTERLMNRTRENLADYRETLKQRDTFFVLLFIFAALLAALLFVLIRGNS